MITGNTLIELGFKPGKWFKEAIEYANQNGLEGDALKSYLSEFAPKHIFPFTESLPYHRNIRAESEAEQVNISQVFATMEALMKTPTLVNGVIIIQSCLSDKYKYFR